MLQYYTLNSILSTSLNVTPSLKSRNPRGNRCSQTHSRSLLSRFPPLHHGFWHYCKPSKKSNHTLALRHIVNIRTPWHLPKWRIHTVFQNHHHIYNPKRFEKPSSSSSATSPSRPPHRAVANFGESLLEMLPTFIFRVKNESCAN